MYAPSASTPHFHSRVKGRYACVQLDWLIRARQIGLRLGRGQSIGTHHARTHLSALVLALCCMCAFLTS